MRKRAAQGHWPPPCPPGHPSPTPSLTAVSSDVRVCYCCNQSASSDHGPLVCWMKVVLQMRNNLRRENLFPVELPWDKVLPGLEAELVCIFTYPIALTHPSLSLASCLVARKRPWKCICCFCKTSGSTWIKRHHMSSPENGLSGHRGLDVRVSGSAQLLETNSASGCPTPAFSRTLGQRKARCT